MSESKKILLIDDDPVILGLLQNKLQEKSYEIFKTTNVEDSIKALSEVEFDLAMVDIILEDKTTSKDIINFIHNRDENIRNPNIPVIMMSAYMSEEYSSSIATKSNRIVKAIKKPIDLDDLENFIDGLFNKQEINLEEILINGEDIVKYNESFSVKEVRQFLKGEGGVGLKNIDFNFQNQQGETPLMVFSYFGEEVFVKKILTYGAPVNVLNHVGRNALHYAVVSNDKPTIKILVEKGCRLDCRDKYGIEPFGMAIMTSELSTLKYLVDLGAPTKSTVLSMTYPMLAIEMRDLPALEFLLQMFVDSDITNDKGENLKEVAKRVGHKKIKKAVIKYLKQAKRMGR